MFEFTLSALTTSQIVNNYAVAFGAFMAGLGGIKILWDLLDRWNKRRNLDYYKDLYSKLNVEHYKLIASKENPDKIYIHDLRINRKRHIASNATFIDLGFDRKDVRLLEPEGFSNIKEGDEILTRGERGS